MLTSTRLTKGLFIVLFALTTSALASAQATAQSAKKDTAAPASQPQVLVTGTVTELDESDHQIKVQSGVVSKVLGEASDVQQLAVGNMSWGFSPGHRWSSGGPAEECTYLPSCQS